ncbi:hypothetical protein B9479_003698 [Cryptococcus floricola]|uniref:Uncharacterized protein n=1 Tax=Cryptococcus floricola TaxID=2591691 RepID=A0A5D3B0I8_9TREE|nr:hypothetical protein B9479_003698 [Cryptococcus floricola]
MDHFGSSPQPPAFNGDFVFDSEEWFPAPPADDANPVSSYLPPLDGHTFTSAPYEDFPTLQGQGLHLTVPNGNRFNDSGAFSYSPSSGGDGSYFSYSSHSGARSPEEEEMFASRVADEGASEIVVGSARSPTQKSTRRGSKTRLDMASRKREQI